MIAQLIDRQPVTLRDGRTVVIRSLAFGDRAALTAFGRALPQAELHCIPAELQSPEAIARLVTLSGTAQYRQIVATAGNAIVGYGAVQQLSGRSREVAEGQLIVSAGWRHCGLGSALAMAMLDAAYELEVSQVVVELLAEQIAGRAIFERLGFSIEGALEGQVCDRYGRYHDLLVMAYRIDDA
jgi:L-amino acid N-acyltransferase YncA